jgi:hypothetical protein
MLKYRIEKYSSIRANVQRRGCIGFECRYTLHVSIQDETWVWTGSFHSEIQLDACQDRTESHLVPLRNSTLQGHASASVVRRELEVIADKRRSDAFFSHENQQIEQIVDSASVRGWVHPRATRDLPVCSTVPQPTTLPRAIILVLQID